MTLEEEATSGVVKPTAGNLIADFVENYDTLIRPAIMDGNIAGANAVIMDACLRFGMTDGDIHFPNPRVYSAYRMALTYLSGIATGGAEAKAHMTAQHSRDSYLNCVDRQVAELDILMTGLKDPDYVRRREKFKHLFGGK